MNERQRVQVTPARRKPARPPAQAASRPFPAQQKAQQVGLTIVELLVAVGLFMVLISALLPSLPQMFKVNRTTMDNQALTVQAKSVIEQTRALWLVKDAANTADPYQNLKNGTLPSVDSTSPCRTITVEPVTYVGTTTKVATRRLTVTCSATGTGTLSFVAEVGRPE